jgi:hypothetical protein
VAHTAEGEPGGVDTGVSLPPRCWFSEQEDIVAGKIKEGRQPGTERKTEE